MGLFHGGGSGAGRGPRSTSVLAHLGGASGAGTLAAGPDGSWMADGSDGSWLADGSGGSWLAGGSWLVGGSGWAAALVAPG